MTKKQTLIEQAPWRQQVREDVDPLLHDLARDLRRMGSTVSLVAEEPTSGHLGWRLRIYPSNQR